MRDDIVIIATPSSSPFAAVARRVAERIPGDLDPASAVRWFADEIRRAYPHAIVRAQDDLARTAASGPPVFYVSEHHPAFRIDEQVIVPLPPDAAFSAYTERVEEWQIAVDLVRRAGPQALVGREYDACYRFLGRTLTGTFRILAADPPRSVTIEASGSGITVEYTTRFEAAGAGCRVTVRGDYALPNTVLARVADRLLLERTIGHDIRRANEAFAAMCRTAVEPLEQPATA